MQQCLFLVSGVAEEGVAQEIAPTVGFPPFCFAQQNPTWGSGAGCRGCFPPTSSSASCPAEEGAWSCNHSSSQLQGRLKRGLCSPLLNQGSR